MAQNPMDPFNSDMNDIFNQLMGGMNGATNRRYMINGHEVTPEEFAQYRQSGQLLGGMAPQQGGQPGPQPNEGKESILHKLGRNLTEEARQGELDPVIGRNKEIQETAEILSRRTKNNPVLVGDAGVGKTAVVEGLAQEIVDGNVPAPIKDKEIISIDISGLEAGTQYRGSFEENMQKLMKSRRLVTSSSSSMKSTKSLGLVLPALTVAPRGWMTLSSLPFPGVKLPSLGRLPKTSTGTPS